MSSIAGDWAYGFIAMVGRMASGNGDQIADAGTSLSILPTVAGMSEAGCGSGAARFALSRHPTGNSADNYLFLK